MGNMTYELVDPEAKGEVAVESSEYRRTHFRVYDEDGFSSNILTEAPEFATLPIVLAKLVEKFHGTGAPASTRRTSSSCSDLGSWR